MATIIEQHRLHETNLHECIAHSGPMPIDAFMAHCLYADGGYYRCQTAIGAAGDFTTAPEISQIFGELIGLWCILTWRQMGAPERVRIVEFGPGRGTLMADLLRALKVAPDFAAVVEVELIEISETLRQMQQTTLASSPVPIRWSDGLAPSQFQGSSLVIGNEFLDAFPVSQAVYQRGQWRLRCVGLDAAGKLAFVSGAPLRQAVDPGQAYSTQPILPDHLQTLPAANEGDILEWRNWRSAAHQPGLADQLADMARHGPLAALFIDYGYEGPQTGDTLQVVRQHRHEHPLAAPGRADLTAYVDFTGFLNDCQACGLVTQHPVSQAQFLGSLGIVERTQRLMQLANPRQANELETGVQRLLAAQGMGGRFLAVGLRTNGLAPLPGFG